MSKLERRNQARQKQLNKHHANAKIASVFSGRDGAPRVAAVVPLCADTDVAAAVASLAAAPGLEVTGDRVRTDVDRFKQKIEWILVQRDLIHALDACRIADFVIFVLSPEQEVDELGELMLRAIEGQGVSTVITATQVILSSSCPI